MNTPEAMSALLAGKQVIRAIEPDNIYMVEGDYIIILKPDGYKERWMNINSINKDEWSIK